VTGLPAGVIPVTRSANQGALTRAHADIAGTCPFDDPSSDLFSPVAAPAGTEEWWNE
jgi:hypothetical protein